MENIVQYIETLIVSFGAIGVFYASVIEEIVVIVPLVLVQTGAGFLLLGGDPISLTSILKLISYVAIPSALGATVGSLIIYALAYYGGMPFIQRYGKYFFVSYKKVEKARLSILEDKDTLKILTILRFTPLFPNTVLTVAAGLLRIPLFSYLISTFIGIFIRGTYLGAIGWLSGRYYSTLGVNYSPFMKFLTVACVIALISFVTHIVVKKKRI